MQVFHGNIITCDDKDTVASYLVEKEGRIAYIGDTLPSIYDMVPPVELEDKAIIPAFCDNFIHFSAFSILKNLFPQINAASNEEILLQLKEYVADTKENIIVCYGTDAFFVEEKHLIEKAQLDVVCPNKPLCILSYDTRAAVANTVLIEMIRYKAATLRGFDAGSGYMCFEAFDAVMELVSKGISTSKVIKAMISGCDYLASQGIGFFNSAGGLGFVRPYDYDMEKALSGSMDNGMQMSISYQAKTLAAAAKKDASRIVYPFIDGSLMAGTALLKDQYSSGHTKGLAFTTEEELSSFCKDINRAEGQIFLYTEGDAAFDMAVAAVSSALEDYPRYDHRHIIHTAMPTAAGLEICKKYDIMLSVLPDMIDYPAGNLELLTDNLSSTRVDGINPMSTITSKGIRTCIDSAAPASSARPLMWIHSLCNRKNKKEEITVYDALRMATYNGAYASFQEKERGSLEMGKSCDMVILSANPYEIKKDKLKNIEVEELYLKGKLYEPLRTNPRAILLRGMFHSY